MSFAKVISLISTMSPTGLGFWGYTGEIIGDWIVWLCTYVMNAFYGVCKWFLAFVDFLQYFIQKLIGLDYWLSPGGKDLKGATESDLLFSFLYNETVQNVFRTLVGLFIVFLIIFTVFAIIRQEWKFVTGTEKDNTKSKILSSSLKAIALVVITPLILVIGIISSNAILASIVKALNVDMSSTFGNTIFSIASVNANKYRIYTESGERTPVSQQVTFYINSNEKLVLFGSTDSEDDYQKVYSDYESYLDAIDDDNATKYTIDSMFPIVVPSKQKEFYGYCASLNIDGTVKYFMVEVDVDDSASAQNKEKISAMYYYLRNVLRANLMANGENIGNSQILKALGNKISSASSSTPCLISKFDIDDCKTDAVYEACYNTWDYSTIYRTNTAFDATTASTVTTNLEPYNITGQSNAKIVYNAYDYQKYFDGGQFGVVQLNAEYGVMTDVIDFICESGANLYILDATSSLIDWKYEGYEIGTKWVSEITGDSPEKYEANGEEYLPFIVDYSETAMDHEEGKTLYLAKANTSNELEGSKFIMCWKVSTESGVKYVPLLNRKTFTDPITKQTFTFKSTYLSNSYEGLVVAKGNFDQQVSSSVNGPANGDPTYLKVGASLGDGKDAIEYTNEPYYYDINKSGTLVQSVSDVQISSNNSMILTNINFDNSSFPNYAMVFDSTDKSLFRFINTNNNSEIDITTNLINSLTVRFVDGSNKDDSAVYAGVNDGTNYLFVSKSSGRVLMLSLTDSKTLTVRGVGEDGSISDSSVVPSEIDPISENTFNSPSFLYEITLEYDGSVVETYEDINPLDLQLSKTADGKSLFSSIDKYYILVGDVDNPVIKQNMTLCAYFNESSLYNIVDGKLEMATPSGDGYNLQMFRVSLYDFMVGYIDNDGIYKYVSSGNNLSQADVIETFDFGIVVDGFEWNADNTEYSVFNGSSYVAKLIKTKGTTFTIDNIADDSKTVGIEIDGKTYYNVKTQNKYASEEAMKNAYDIIERSMFVGCYRDRATTDFLTIDFNFAIGSDWRCKPKLNIPVIEKEELMNKTYGVFSLTDGIAFDYFFETGSLLQFYNAYKVAYWIILIAAALIIKTLGTALWGVIKRFYEVTLYYLAMPVVASTMPLDGGKKFGQIQEGLIKNVLGAYGVILGINMFFILLSPVRSLSNIFTQAEMDSSSSYFLRHFPFGAKVLNNYVYILFVLVAFTMIDSLPTIINGFVGNPKDVVSEGRKTKDNVGNAAKNAGDMISGKALMDGAGKVITEAGKMPLSQPIKWAAGKIRGGVDNIRNSFSSGASQEDDDAAQKNNGNNSNNGSSQSSRADGSSETQTTSQNSGEKENEQSGLNETQAGEVREIVSNMLDGQGNEDGEESANDKNDDSESDESQEAKAAAEYNKKKAKETSEGERAEVVKNMAKEGTNQEVTNAMANKIVGNSKELGQGQNGDGVGLSEDVICEIIRQILGEQANGMTNDDIKDKYEISLGKDVMGNNIASLIKKEKNADGSVSVEETQLDNSQISALNSAIVANASDEQVKAAYGSLDKEQKEEVDGVVAESVSGVSFAGGNATLDNASVNALKLIDKYKNNEDVENAVILKTMQADQARMDAFMRESGLSKNASEEEKLETIAKMKNSQNVNAAKLTLEDINEKGLTDAHAAVVAEMFASGKIKATAWDLASDAEKQEFMANRKVQNHELTAEEQEIEKELNMQAVRDYEKTDKADYDKHIIEAYVSDNSIENKTELSKNILLAATGLDNINNLSYKKAAQDIKHAEFSDGNKKFDLAELAKKGYSGEDVMFAYQKMKLLADKDGKIDGKKIHKDNGKLDADLLMKMLEKPDENTSEALTKLTEKDASARQTVSDMLMKGTNGKTPVLTSDQQDALVSKIAEGDGNGNTFIAKQLGKGNKGSDREAAYKQVIDEQNKRKQVENIYATQGSLINEEMLNKASGSENYKALLDQINAMKDKAGEARVTSIKDEDLQKLINNEDNVGYDPTELVNLRKEIIRAQIDDKNTPKFSKVIDSSSLSGQDKTNFEYKKSIIEDQVKAEGENSETLANLFKNSNFVGKDELQDIINSTLKSMGVDDPSKASKEQMNQAISEALKGKDDVKNTLLSIGATDITKAISTDNLKEKQLDLIKNDVVLSKQVKDALDKDGVKEGDKNFETKYNAKINELMSSNASFKGRLDDKLQNMIDPSKQVSDEDKENFFRSKAKASDVTGVGDSIKDVGDSIKNGVVNVKTAFNGWLNSNASDQNAGFAKKFGSAVVNVSKDAAKNTWIKGKTKIQNFAAENDNNALKMTGAILRTPFVSVAKSGAVQSIVYKVTKSAPKKSEKYNKWNEILDKDIEAVKSGKGVYAQMSKDERKAKVEELKSKKIDSKLPDEYASWDNAKQTAYMQQQILLKNEAFNANFSEIKRKQKAEKPKDKNVILKFADNLGYSAGKVPILGAVTAKFASKELKEKHEQDLAIAAANIDRYKSSAPMRNKSSDFGANFENFAKSYISKNAIERIQKDIAKKGLTDDKAAEAREAAFAREINKQYKVASAKVARDQGVDKNSFLKEKGIDAGNVRYKDGTKRFTQVKSRLNLHIPGVNALVNKAITEKRKNDIINYEDEYKRTKGNVSEKTRKKYEKSYYGKRSEEAAIRSQNEARAQQKLHDEILEFNKSFKGKSSDYADEFKKKFGDELYKKYNKLFNVGAAGSKIKSTSLNLENSPAIVQQRELIRQLEREMKKNLNRQKYASAYIPASELAAAKFRVESLTNKKTKASIANDRQMAQHYNQALKEFMAQKGNPSYTQDKFFDNLSPVIREQFESKFNNFKKSIAGFDKLSPEKQKDYLQRFLETQLEKYNKRVVNNSFTPSQLQNLVKLNGTYLDKSKVQNSRISNTVLKSLNATDADVYKNLVKNVNSARAKVNNENANLDNLKRALKEVQSGIQNNAARAEAEKIRKAIANSEIKLNNLKGVLGTEEARKKAFEQAIASDRIKKAIRENARAAAAATPANRPIDYRRADGTPRVVKPGSLDQRQIQELEKKFMAQAKAELDYMAKVMVSKESQKLVEYINKTNKKLTQDAQENIRNLKSIQENIRKELKTLIDKNDKKTKMYKDDLNMQNQKLDNLIKKMTREFAKMDIII